MIKECPLCKEPFKKGICSNLECVLSYIKPKEPTDWSHLFWKATHLSFSDVKNYIRARFFKRYDLIRTGCPKHHWVDKVELMLHGMMNLLVEYVEKEEAFNITNGDEPYGTNTIPFKDQVMKLYIDWKVNYPKMQKEYDDMLTNWCDGQTMKITNHKLEFEYHRPENIQDALHDELNKKEESIYEFEQRMLHDVVDIRRALWS